MQSGQAWEKVPCLLISKPMFCVNARYFQSGAGASLSLNEGKAK